MSHHPSVKQYGLTQIYAPPRGEIPTVDIVLVHGLNGHPESSWTSKTTGCFWPVDLLPDVLGPLRPRILTYGYNANVVAFTDGASRDSVVSHAETLASSLAANRNLRSCPNRPIIFICHSLGGLVVKRALIYSRSVSNEKTEHLRSVYVSTFGILFLGTPHNGSDMAKWGLLLQKICTAVLPKKFMEGSPQLIKSLQTNNETLQHINSLFADIMSRFHIYFFHETRSMDVKGTREVIVDESSAAPYFEGVERGGIEADHSHMCKFDDENSPGYEVVAEAILRYSREAPSVIADRWIEERKTRSQERQAKARELCGPTDDPLGQSHHSVPNLVRGAATDGRDPTVSGVGQSDACHPLSRSLIHFPSQREPALFVVPPGFHPNATFVGMEKALEELHKRLYKAKARAKGTMAVLITGVPGSGKTHLARQYVFTQCECYPGGIFWVDAKSRESIYKCFWEIAQAATLIDPKEADEPKYQKPQTYVDAVRNWLQARHDWLLIFDGMLFDTDKDINEFRSFLPWSTRCSVIYTSINANLRKKQRLFEPYRLCVPRLEVEDACRLLYRDLSIRRPTIEQSAKAAQIAKYHDCLPLAIHAVGHRLNATGMRIEKYRLKGQVTDEKLAEPFLNIMNDLYRLEQREALNLINLLSFLGHQVPVGLLVLGKSIMTTENAEILSSAQSGEEPNIDTTLGTLISYGLVERTSDLDIHSQLITSSQYSGDEIQTDPRPTPPLTDSFTESSQEEFFSLYRNNSEGDVVKIHSVVQTFCRNELRSKDDDHSEVIKRTPGFYDSWLIVATRFLCRSYEMAREKMSHYNDCGLVRDYREYETHASRLVELYPRRSVIDSHPAVLREARETLKQLMRSLSNEIERMSPSSSQESTRNQKSVFDRSSSSSSSFPESSPEEGFSSRQSTLNWTEPGLIRAASPEEMARVPQFRLELFPPRLYHHVESGSDDGYETDGDDAKAGRLRSPALSLLSQNTELPPDLSASQSPPISHDGSQEWQTVQHHSTVRPSEHLRQGQRSGGPRQFRSPQLDAPLVQISPVEGRGSSSRTSSGQSGSSSSVSTLTAESALSAMKRINQRQASSGKRSMSESSVSSASIENMPPYDNRATTRMPVADEISLRRPASMPISTTADAPSNARTIASAELDGHTGRMFGSPLAHELMSHDIVADEMSQSAYREAGHEELTQSLTALDVHGGETTLTDYRSSSLQATEEMSVSTPTLIPQAIAVSNISASTPSLFQYAPSILPLDHNVSISVSPNRPFLQQNAAAGIPTNSAKAPNPLRVAHPSAILPGSVPLSSAASDSMLMGERERVGSEPLSRLSSTMSTQSYATEPVRSPPQFSPPFVFGSPSEVSSPLPMAYQGSLTAPGFGGNSSAVQSQQIYALPVTTHGRIGSVDERLGGMSQMANSGSEVAAFLPFAGHRIDVRDPRVRLQEVGRFQTPRNIPSYRLYHPNVSGPLALGHEQVYVPVRTAAMPFVRPRSGSSPANPNRTSLDRGF
ncbi:hypothetical protein N7539_001886 [Penicillium diatomitis]|uniref:NB-ARC domain-containing protein n=1 Tax=Penicillium diatomitis TaxID=2819901 RepID=A0A9W9XIB3_9EURO|nr:uncharacterized protein N7539_001886 [Penicillium diatomitis]KAJ5493140.1 hypothetical protein N7539_001886 [Penicillium diatomitis]